MFIKLCPGLKQNSEQDLSSAGVMLSSLLSESSKCLLLYKTLSTIDYSRNSSPFVEKSVGIDKETSFKKMKNKAVANVVNACMQFTVCILQYHVQ